MDFSEYLKKQRKNRNLTQQELAEKLQVTKQAVSKWEKGNGAAYPDIMSIPKLAEVLGVPPMHIMNAIWNGEKERICFEFTCVGKPVFPDERVPVEKLRTNKYRVRCEERVYNRILSKYGDQFQIKTVSPDAKVLKILRNRENTYQNFSPEETYDVFLDEACSRLCGVIYQLSGKKPGYARLSLLRASILDAYQEVLTYERFMEFCYNSDSQSQFDKGYLILCDALLAKEKEILELPVFANVIYAPPHIDYLSPHFVIQSIFTELVTCGMISPAHPVYPYLHYTIPAKQHNIDFEKWDMSDFWTYLRYQDDCKQRAVQAGVTRMELSLAEEKARKDALAQKKEED